MTVFVNEKESLMATPGRKLDVHSRREVTRLREIGWSIRAIAKALRLSTRTVRKYASQS